MRRPRAWAASCALGLCAGTAVLMAGCASDQSGDGREVLLQTEPEPVDVRPDATALPLDAPASFPFRPPPGGEASYRLVVEYGGEEEISTAGAMRAPTRIETSDLFELEYRELGVKGHADVLRVALDGLHSRHAQADPKAEREVELADDRIRTLADTKVVLDLRGAQPKEDLTPRKVLGHVFGVLRLDAQGSVVGMQPQGEPVARRFLEDLPLLRVLSYARPALPAQPVSVGARWTASRLPVTPAGDVGLLLPVEYTLAGFQRLEGVACAWLSIHAAVDGENVPSAAGFSFERVLASLDGEAWVELATSRIRLLKVQDEVRAAYSMGRDPAPVVQHRLRHRTRLALELRDPAARPARWADGSERFGVR